MPCEGDRYRRLVAASGLRYPHQRFAHADDRALLEPAHFFTFLETSIAGDDIWAAILEVERDIEEMQANAGDKDRRYRHQGYGVIADAELCLYEDALVLAK